MNEDKIIEIVKNNDVEIFELVVDKYNGNINALFQQAIESCSDKIVGYILSHYQNIDINAYIGEYPLLMHAITWTYYYETWDDDYCKKQEAACECVSLLCNAGVNVNLRSKNQQSCTALQLLGKHTGGWQWNGFKLMEILVQHGADIFYEDDDGHDAFYDFVAKKGNIESEAVQCLRVLMEQGVDINRKYYHEGNRTVLQMIAAGNHWSRKAVWKALLKAGADINEQDENGYTALMLSVCHNWYFSDELDMARELLRHGADRYVRAFDGKTFDSIAQERNIDISSLAGLGRF